MRRRILVVDDESDFVDMIKIRLEANGYEVITAANGEEGLEKAELYRPNLILLDVMMPGIDGFETARRLQLNAGTREIPIIMLSAKGDTNTMLRAEDMYAKEYLTKPCDTKVMLESIARFIKKEPVDLD